MHNAAGMRVNAELWRLTVFSVPLRGFGCLTEIWYGIAHSHPMAQVSLITSCMVFSLSRFISYVKLLEVQKHLLPGLLEHTVLLIRFRSSRSFLSIASVPPATQKSRASASCPYLALGTTCGPKGKLMSRLFRDMNLLSKC